jgi:hypothetical protein
VCYPQKKIDLEEQCISTQRVTNRETQIANGEGNPDMGARLSSRIEQARLEYQPMKEIEFPEEAEQGQRALEMPDASSDLVQKQLSELAQHVVHIMQACNEEKVILEDEFDLVQANIDILETRVHTDKYRVDAAVA